MPSSESISHLLVTSSRLGSVDKQISDFTLVWVLLEEEKAPSEVLANPLPRKESEREREGTSPLQVLQGAHVLRVASVCHLPPGHFLASHWEAEAARSF